MFFFSIEIVIIKKKFLIIKKEGVIESSCVEQVFFLVDENRSEFYCFKKLEVSTCKSQNEGSNISKRGNINPPFDNFLYFKFLPHIFC